jgi:transposase
MEKIRLPKRFNNTAKLVEEDIKEIRSLKNQGISCVKIAEMFGVSSRTIYYWTNEKDRQSIIKRTSKYATRKRKSDPEYAESMRVLRRVYIKKCEKIILEQEREINGLKQQIQWRASARPLQWWGSRFFSDL